MAYHGNPYSEAEDEVVRRGYERRETLPQIAAKTNGRTIYSVSGRARMLGLVHPNGTRNQNARRGKFAFDDFIECLPPTLPYVPGISVTKDSKYQMRSV